MLAAIADVRVAGDCVVQPFLGQAPGVQVYQHPGQQRDVKQRTGKYPRVDKSSHRLNRMDPHWAGAQVVEHLKTHRQVARLVAVDLGENFAAHGI